MSVWKSVLLAALVVTTVGGAAACGGASTQPSGNAAVNGGTSVVKGSDGKNIVVRKLTSIPADFPSDVPVYKGEMVFGNSASDNGFTGWNVVIATPDSPDVIGAWYDKRLKAGGWDFRNGPSVYDPASQYPYEAVGVFIGDLGLSVLVIAPGQSSIITDNRTTVKLTATGRTP